jgi:hypothetical protein
MSYADLDFSGLHEFECGIESALKTTHPGGNGIGESIAHDLSVV